MSQSAHASALLRKLFVVGLSLLTILAGAGAATPVRHALAQAEGQDRNLDLVLLIDESGSTWGRTDPEHSDGSPPYRIQAAQLLINLFSVEQGRTNPNHRVAVYFFGTQVEEVIPLQSIAGSGQASKITQKIEDDHRKLGNLRWTDTVAAFSKADEVLRALPTDPGRRAVVVMITDGRPETANANTQDGENTPAAQNLGDYLDQNTAAIKTFASMPNSTGNCKAMTSARPVYLLGVDKEAADAYVGTPYVLPEYHNLWQQELGNQYRQVHDFKSLSGTVSLLVAELLCAVGETPSGPEPLPKVWNFDVQASHTSVTFTTINSDKNTQTTIIPPGGSPLTATSPGVKVEQSPNSQVWSVSRDHFSGQWAGQWMVKVEGPGTAQFAAMSFSDSYAVRLLQPIAELYPAGRPLDVLGQVVNRTDEIYTQPTQAFDLNAVRTANDGSQSSFDLPMARTANSSYQTRIERPKPGRYTLNVVADLGNNQVAKLAPARTIAVVKLPYLVLVEPRVGTPLFVNGQFVVSISANSMGENDAQPRPIDTIIAHQTTISATLRNPSDGSTLEIIPLAVEADSGGVTHAARLPSPATPGTYELIVRLEYPLKDQVFTDSFTRTLTFQPAQVVAAPPITLTAVLTPTVTVTPPPPRSPGDPMPFLLGFLGLAAVGGAGTWWWLTVGRMGKLDGTWFDTPTGQVSLRGRGHKLDLFDNSGVKQGQIKLSRDQTGQVSVHVVRLGTGQNLTIGGSPYGQGDVVPINDSNTVVFDNQTWTFNQ